MVVLHPVVAAEDVDVVGVVVAAALVARQDS